MRNIKSYCNLVSESLNTFHYVGVRKETAQLAAMDFDTAVFS